MLRYFFLLPLFCFMLVSCNNSGGDKARPEDNQTGETITEEYTYEFKFLIPQTDEDGFMDGKCYASGYFKSKTEYCEGLRSWHRNNHGCAVEGRKNLYLKNCGNDFVENDFRPLRIHTYTASNKLVCDNDKMVADVYGVKPFDSREDFCAHLLDNSVFPACTYAERASQFKRAKCLGLVPPIQN